MLYGHSVPQRLSGHVCAQGVKTVLSHLKLPEESVSGFYILLRYLRQTRLHLA